MFIYNLSFTPLKKKSNAVQDIEELEETFFQNLSKALQQFPSPQPKKRGRGMWLHIFFFVLVTPRKAHCNSKSFGESPQSMTPNPSIPLTAKDSSLAP